MITFRTIILPKSIVDTVRNLTWMIAWPEQAEWMWNTPLSSTWEAPATHFISSWMIDWEFADLIPLYWYNEEWVWSKLYEWQSELIHQSSGVPVEQIDTLFSIMDISEEDSISAMSRLWLKLIA